MTHKTGDEIVIRWPGGPHDYRVEYYDAGQMVQPPPRPGFQYIRGVVIEPDFGSHWRSMRTFYVRPLGDGEYSLLPLPRASPRPAPEWDAFVAGAKVGEFDRQ